jgi:hypothetical protein
MLKCPLFETCKDACCCCEDVYDKGDITKQEAINNAKEYCFHPKAECKGEEPKK